MFAYARLSEHDGHLYAYHVVGLALFEVVGDVVSVRTFQVSLPVERDVEVGAGDAYLGHQGKVAALVAALKHLPAENKRVVSILSGGNMDVITMSSVVQHGLIMRDRIFTVSVLLPDRPGMLVRVAQVIAEKSGNVIKLEHNQFVSTNRNAAVELRVTIEAFGTDHKEQIVDALKDAGFTPTLVQTSL